MPSHSLQQTETDQLGRHPVNILAAPFLADSRRHHHDNHCRPLHSINNPVALSHSAYAAVPGEVIVQRLALQFRIGLQGPSFVLASFSRMRRSVIVSNHILRGRQ